MRTFVIISKIFLFVFLLSNIIYSQTPDSISIQDSVKQTSKSEYKLRLNNKVNIVSPLVPLKLQAAFDTYDDFVLPPYGQVLYVQNAEELRLRNNMSKALQVYRAGLIKNDLGVVGQVLGYTNAAAAIGLAAYHVYKYRNK